MIDLHCHLLPGIDDGPADVAAALAQAREHVERGVTHVVCTPHVSHGHRNTSEGIRAATQSFAGDLADAGIPLSIASGAEVSLSRAIELPDEELTALHLAGTEWLLLEPPLGSDVPRMPELVHGLQSRGHKILIAHPERCAGFHHDGDLLEQLVEGGALAQVTTGSLTGQFGSTVQKLSMSMIRDGLIHVLASDAHDATRRPPGLDADGLGDFGAWAADSVPKAMLGGDEIPAPPAFKTPRKRLFSR